MGEKSEGSKLSSFGNITGHSYGCRWTRHFVFAYILIRWTPALNQSSEFLYSFGSPDKSHNICCIIMFWSMSCFCCCASVFKGSICLESQSSQIFCFNTRVSPCLFDPSIYIFVLVSCHWWGIHQGPPSTSMFVSTSTHYPGTRLRNQLVPWDLHASMAGIFTSDSGFTSLTPDRMIPWIFDFNSSSHIRWNVLGYLWNHWHQWWFPSHLLTVYLIDR